MKDTLTLIYPNIPPSLNSLYQTNRRTGVVYMVKEGKAFKEEFSKYAKENWISKIHSFNSDAIYKINFDFYFPEEEIINKEFGKDKRIKNKYKKVDVDNRVKLLLDLVSSVFGFNDTQVFSFSAQKYMTFGSDRATGVTIEEVNLEDFKAIVA